MKLKSYLAVFVVALAATAVLFGSDTFAQATSHEAPTEIVGVEPELFDQKGEKGDLFVVGNATNECNQLGYDYGYKKDDPTSDALVGIGDGMLIDYSFDGGNQGTILEWSSNLGIDAVILKASTLANVYRYNPEAVEDAGLRTPYRDSKKGRRYYGISHVTFCWDRELLVSKTADVEYDREFLWGIEKSVDPTSQDLFAGQAGTAEFTIEVSQTGHVDTNFAVTGDITVSNPWTATAENVVVSDVLAIPECGAFDGTLQFGESVVCNYGVLIPSEDDLPATNTAVATADGFQDQSHTVAIEKGEPSTLVDQFVTVSDQQTEGGVTSSVAIPASLTGIQGDVYSSYPVTYSGSYVVARSSVIAGSTTVSNVASLSGDTSGSLGSSSAATTFNWYAPTIDKQVDSTGFTREFFWDVDKSVTPHSHELFVGESATSTFTVEVTQTGQQDSSFNATGSITVSNPHPTQSMTVTVDDAGAVLDTAMPITIAAGSGATVGWTKDDGDIAPAAPSNTASFTLYGLLYSDTEGYSYVEPDVLVNESVAVNDSIAGVLGTTNGSTSYTYPHEETCVEPGDVTVTNIADLVGDEGQVLDSATATATWTCSPPPPPPSGDGHETAFMVGEECFLDWGFSRWGWTEQIEGPIFRAPIYAGAGQCDLDKGTRVGYVEVFAPIGGFMIIMLPGYHLDEVHIEWDDNGMFAENASGAETVAPGKYDWVVDGDLDLTGYQFVAGEDITGNWVMVHIVAG